MATYTTNYQLKKPDQEDFFDITDANQNMDTLDAELFALASALGDSQIQPSLDSIIATLGTTDNTGGSQTSGTVMAKLNAIQQKISLIPTSVVKSIQKGSVSGDTTNSVSVSISPVNPQKSIVLLNNYNTTSVYCGTYLSSLSSNSLYIKMAATSDRTITSWQVIEFY
ncbi:MAG: hypothetical protein GX299_02415 [Epulopiscium sp.]|jgi:hypothetical protein|nr:hypothetical protein [Candidatus Epulonipiscium sp.]